LGARRLVFGTRMPDASARHILIAGPGRSGTTLLVELLDALGLETGAERLKYSEESRAGFEAELLGPEVPRVVKSPALSWRLRSLIETGRFDPARVECLLVPLRRLDAVAASRVKTTIEQGDLNADGGMVGRGQPGRQPALLAELIYGLFETAALYELPVVTLEYPRFATDVDYAYRRLRPLLDGCSPEAFERAWQSAIDPALISNGLPRAPRNAGLRVAFMRTKANTARRLRGLRRGLTGGR